jgi:ABC-type dipeptide/oligopeptide/nickel transport system ATPase component
MKVVYLIGLPGCGKSTVMKEFMSNFSDWKQERVGDLTDSHVSGKVRVLGKYEEGETFSGTDRLSMAVSPDAIKFVESKPDEFILGEGDRLNNKGFFNACGDDLTIIHLTVSDSERNRRYEERGSNQPEKFIQTVRTKVNNIVEAFGDQQTLFGEEKGCVVQFKHETLEDTKKIVSFIMESVV